MKKIYLSGKIAGLPEAEYQQNFANAAMRALDLFPDEQVTIVNPAALPAIHNSWVDYMLRDLMLLKDCDAIVMLPDWTQSNGAKVERDFAIGAGIEVFYLPKPDEMVLSHDEMQRIGERIKDSTNGFAAQGIATSTHPIVKLTDGMLRYKDK